MNSMDHIKLTHKLPLRHEGLQRTQGFRKLMTPAVMAWLWVVSGASPAYAALDNSFSSLDIAGPISLANSDPAASNFQSNYLPSLVTWIKQNLPETVAVKNFSSMTLDPSMLTVKTTQDVRVYFVGEGAGYQNTLGINATGTGVKTGDPDIVFPNASSSISTYVTTSPTGVRTASEPLMPGDFVDLGTMQAGTQLDFFLIANGAQGGTNVFSTTTSANPDGIRHVVAYAAKDSPYLLISFEDLLGGGDKDYNDVLIAVSGVQLTTAPEPSTMFILGSFLLPVLYLVKRQNSNRLQEACS